MIRHLFSISLMCTCLPALADYKEDIMEPWIGATQEELTVKWGYPQTANDVVKIDDETTIFTYRSFQRGFGGRMHCMVSFTIKKKIVSGYKYEGGHCPKFKRYK